ncbi:MAG: ankyrin repeat domain-containing protein, partial [Anaplasma sp.]|nr:ankyrin repeat domain-containing protein [Anaplasma sp.]
IGALESQILALAAYSSQVGVMKWLLEHEVIDVNKANGYGFTALHFAASVNCVPAVEMLLDAGADMEAKRAPYPTAAHIAALNESLDVLVCMHRKCPQALLCVDADGQDILHYAASSAND